MKKNKNTNNGFFYLDAPLSATLLIILTILAIGSIAIVQNERLKNKDKISNLLKMKKYNDKK